MIIVGSGITGAACALEAATLGAEVILVDAGLDGRATAAGAGIVSPWLSRVEDPAWHDFAAAAAREYPLLVERLADAGETETGYRRVGALYLCDDETEAGRVFKRAVRQSADTPEIGEAKMLSGRSARELFPPLREDKPAVHISGAARVDGRLMAAALRRAAAMGGATRLSGTASLLVRGSRVRGVEINGGTIEGDAVVAAAGAWTGQFTGQAAPVRTEPQRGQIMHFSLPGTDTSRWPVILPTSSGHYMLAFEGGRIVAGATREAGSGFDYRKTAGGLAEVLSEALGVAPGLSGATVAEIRIGFRPMGPDVKPLLGPVPGTEGLVVATGLGASGLTMGPRAGAIAARVALGTDPGEDLAPFDPLR